MLGHVFTLNTTPRCSLIKLSVKVSTIKRNVVKTIVSVFLKRTRNDYNALLLQSHKRVRCHECAQIWKFGVNNKYCYLSCLMLISCLS